MPLTLRRAGFSDMGAVAKLHRHVRDISLPYLPRLHTPQEDLAFFQNVVFPGSMVWLAEAQGKLIGFAAVRNHWLDHLYVDPSRQGEGIGSSLLSRVREGCSRLDLWTFQRNVRAQRFYEGHGFKPVEVTDGSGNEEKMPDIRYRWIRD